MGGGDAPTVPGPSAAEQALQQSQKEMLDLQRTMIEKSAKEQELLAPILYKSLGIEPQYDAEGKLTGYKEDANAEKKRGIESALLDRSEAALKGELPINPALTRDLDEQEAQLKERLFRQLGPGWETSTPGIDALSNFNKRKNELFDASRRGDLTLAEGLGIARDSAGLNTFGATMNAGNRFLPAGSGAGAGAAGYGGAAAALASDRLASYQGELTSFQNDQNTWSNVFKGIGGLAGQLGGAALFKYSDERLKTDIERVGETDGGLPIYKYRYIDGGPKELGVMAHEVAAVRPDAVEKFGDFFAVDYSKVR